MPATPTQLDEIIDKLARDIEASVHAMYRGQVRQNTVKARTEGHRKAARDALSPLVAGGPAAALAASAAAPAAGEPPTSDEVAAITRCVMAWLPMGAPSAATPDSRCIPGGRELLPSWGDREKARQAIRRLQQG
ncbi:MAG TPA: hypothetical protein VNA89_00645 [Gemmatimonadaceae bacterium]|nr:hypothetical protein [Gemmatimonadaceae bacterium]